MTVRKKTGAELLTDRENKRVRAKKTLRIRGVYAKKQ